MSFSYQHIDGMRGGGTDCDYHCMVEESAFLGAGHVLRTLRPLPHVV